MVVGNFQYCGYMGGGGGGRGGGPINLDDNRFCFHLNTLIEQVE